MTQLEEYEALAQCVADAQKSLKVVSHGLGWDIIDDHDGSVLYGSIAEFREVVREMRRINARAALAVIAEKAKEWPTERMVKAWSDTLRNVMDYSDTESAEATLCAREDWSLMLAASPLVKPEDPK